MEQTLGGAAIGTVRDAVSTPQSQIERAERAQENDMATLIAADTAAIIPKFGTLTAGVTRAGLLVNPHQGLADNAGSFALNMGEGMALNRVGKAMLPGSRLQASIATSFSTPLKREIATHLAVGAGFGTVKSGFAPATWVDENGHFAPVSAVGKITTSATVGALLNVPGGMVGVRTMKGSMALMAESQISPKVATTIAAAGSGYTSGALFGGIDAVSKGKGLSETLSEMHFAGKVGLVTGTAVGALDRGSLHQKYRQLYEHAMKSDRAAIQERAVQERTSVLESGAPRRRTSADDLVIEEQDFFYDRKPRPDNIYERLDIRPRTEYGVAEIAPRLKNPRVETETVRVIRADAKEKFDSFSDFYAQTEPKELKMRVYDIEGHTAKLAIEEGLAVKMEANRRYRSQVEALAQKEIAFDHLPKDAADKISMEWPVAKDHRELLTRYLGPEAADDALPVILARLKLQSGRAANIAIPEDFVVLLDEVPNRGMVKRLTLVDEPNPQDVWNKQKFNDPKFESAATASGDGTITYYLTKSMSQARPTLRMFMGHEFAHLAAKASPEETSVYGLAQMVDKDIPNPNYREVVATVANDGATPTGSVAPLVDRTSPISPDKKLVKYFSRQYATTNVDEDGAVHMGEEMLSPDADKLITLGREAPVRTMVLASSLKRSMQAAKPGEQSTHVDILKERLAYVDEEVYPTAMRILEKRLKTGSFAEQAAAAELIGHYGRAERHINMLRKVASDPGLVHVVPEGVPSLTKEGYRGAIDNGITLGGKPSVQFAPIHEGRTIADIAFDGMLRMHEGNVSDQMYFLAREAMPGSPTRQIAQTRLGQARDASAPGYLKFSEMAGNVDRLPELLDLMYKIPDANGKAMVFQEAMALGASSPRFRQTLIARALEIPGLSDKAIKQVAPDEAHLYESQLNKLAAQASDKGLRERATTLLSNMSAEVSITRAVALLRSDNPRGVQQGIDLIINSKTADNRVILPLLQVKSTAPEALSRAAQQALLRFHPQVVKFYANQLKSGAVTRLQ